NFGNNIFIDYRAYRKGYTCCEPVARIGREAIKGDGTGFLVKGSDLHGSWSDDPVLLTNAHVLSDDAEVNRKYGALQPEEAIITFEALDRKEEFGVGSVIWSSPPDKLDVTILRFSNEDMARLGMLIKDVTLYKI